MQKSRPLQRGIGVSLVVSDRCAVDWVVGQEHLASLQLLLVISELHLIAELIAVGDAQEPGGQELIISVARRLDGPGQGICSEVGQGGQAFSSDQDASSSRSKSHPMASKKLYMS